MSQSHVIKGGTTDEAFRRELASASANFDPFFYQSLIK